MKTVKVKKEELLEELRSNLETHKSEYEEMVEKYYDAIGVEANKVILQVMDKRDIDLYPLKNVSVPELHESSYNRAIKMAEMSVDDVIEMEEKEFNQLVMDEWSWSHMFNNTKSAYGL